MRTRALFLARACCARTLSRCPRNAACTRVAATRGAWRWAGRPAGESRPLAPSVCRQRCPRNTDCSFTARMRLSKSRSPAPLPSAVAIASAVPAAGPPRGVPIDRDTLQINLIGHGTRPQKSLCAARRGERGNTGAARARARWATTRRRWSGHDANPDDAVASSPRAPRSLTRRAPHCGRRRSSRSTMRSFARRRQAAGRPWRPRSAACCRRRR